jgi:hypothetical protein
MNDVIDVSLADLTDFSQTANWRYDKAVEYPQDARNFAAAERLSAFADELASLEGSAVHKRMAAAARAVGADVFSETVLEHLRAVGFGSWPETAAELLNDIAVELERRPPIDEDSAN